MAKDAQSDSPGYIYVGIDPGKKGAVAAIYNEGQKVESWYVPIHVIRNKKRGRTPSGNARYTEKRQYDLNGFLSLLFQFNKLVRAGWRVIVGIEEQNPRPMDSNKTKKSVGMSQAYWEMACVANKLAYQLIPPSVWKPKYVTTGANKQASVFAAQSLYPELSFPKAKDTDRAEAVLIADYLMRKERKLGFPGRRAG